MDIRAVIFVPALVAAALCAFAFFTFAAHYYLTILESTAAGSKDVIWHGESITDAFWKPFYLGWLLVLWLGPAYVIGRSLAGSSGAAWLGLAVPVFVAWALYPVSQLSSLCSSSVWMPLHPQVFARLAQKPAAVAGFFALTLPVFALGGVAFRWAFLTSGEWELLFVGVPLLSLALLLYARLLGRLAFALMFTRDLLRRKKKKKPKKEKAGADAPAADKPEPEPAPQPVQPSDMPPVSTPDGELVGYNVLIADDPPPRPAKKRLKAELAEENDPPPEPAPISPPPPPRRKPAKTDHPLERNRTWTDEDDEDATPYEMKPSEVKDEERVPEAMAKPSADEMALLDRSDAVKPPKRVWTAEVFAFLLHPNIVSALVILSGVALLAGAAVRVARQFNPAAGGE